MQVFYYLNKARDEGGVQRLDHSQKRCNCISLATGKFNMVIVLVSNRRMKFKEKGHDQLTFLLIGSSSFSNRFDLVFGLHEIFLWINCSKQ